MNAQVDLILPNQDSKPNHLWVTPEILETIEKLKSFDNITTTKRRIAKLLDITVSPNEKWEKKIFLKKHNWDIWWWFDEVWKSPITLEDWRDVLWAKDWENEMYLDVLTWEDVVWLFPQKENTTIQ